MTHRHLPMTPTRLFGRIMLASNKAAYQRALTLIEVPPNGSLLEIGFGPGGFLDLLLAKRPDVRVAGVDPTPDMVAMANAKKRIKRAGARADLRQADAAHLPWPDESFDSAIAIHSFQFWSPPDVCAQEVRRILKPGGQLVLILRDHSKHAPDWLPNPISRSGNEIEETLSLLRSNGFAEARFEGKPSTAQVILARKSR